MVCHFAGNELIQGLHWSGHQTTQDFVNYSRLQQGIHAEETIT